MDYTAIAAAIASAIFWYRAVALENLSPWLWITPSVGISGVIMLGFGGGWVAVILGQAAMFLGVTVYRTISDNGGTKS